MSYTSFFGLHGYSFPEVGELQDLSRVRFELTWSVARRSPPLQWGCYVLSAFRRSTGDLLRQEWRLELTREGIEPSVERLVYGGAESLVCSSVYRSYPPTLALGNDGVVVIAPSSP
jgi:hypothetical protein